VRREFLQDGVRLALTKESCLEQIRRSPDFGCAQGRRVDQIRQVWPNLRIVQAVDSGFCREELMAWCGSEGLDYLLGLAKSERLNKSSRNRPVRFIGLLARQVGQVRDERSDWFGRTQFESAGTC
jgi:Transposase DDE domain group 1